MVSRSVLKASLAVAAGLAAALVAGCSAPSLSSSSSPRQAVLLAARHADSANSVTATFSMRLNLGGSGDMTMSGQMAEQIRPSLLVQATVPAIQIGSQNVPGGMTEIVTDQAFYLKSSLLAAAAGGKPWIEMRFSDLGSSGNALSQLMQQAQNSSPLSQTQMLAGATGVRKLGTSVIDGVPVTEYTGHYTMAAAIAKLPASDRQSIKQQIDKAGLTGADFTIWLDGQDQVRKLTVTEYGSSVSMTMTMLVTSINQPVTVQLPAASQVKVLSASDLGSGN
jgi:hypothetical protein